MQTQIIDAEGRTWTVRRTSTDRPGRAYHALLAVGASDRGDIMPGVIGFYGESIDDMRHKLSGGR